MKKIIALVLSVIMMFSCLGIAASATSVVGRSSYPLGKPECTTNSCQKPTRPCPPAPTCPSKPECTTKEECTTIVNNVTNVTNNNITIMPEQDPTTLFGFLYRIIKTVVPYLYKILSLINVEISFGGNNNCDNCGNNNNNCNCGNGNNGGNNGNVNDDFTIVIPSIPSVDAPTGGNTDSDSADSDSADSDSDSMDSILGGLFGDLFA